jgi:hypothetical protein
MGQVTLPVLNRKGYSSAWENSWDDVKNYSNIFSEDIFLQRYVLKMLTTYNSSSHNLLASFKKCDFFITRHLPFLEKEDNMTRQQYKEFLNERVKKIPSYFSRIFIIRYNTWIILYTYIYIPKIWKNRIKRIQKKKKIPFLLDVYSNQSRKLKVFDYGLRTNY